MTVFIISLAISGWVVFWLYPRAVMIYALSRALTAMGKVHNGDVK